MTVGSDSGVVYDLGYQPHEGERLGRRGAVIAVVKDGLRRVMGIRRRARKKILPWILIIVAVLPPVVGIGISVFTSDFIADLPGPFTHYGSFPVLANLALLFIAFAAPELVIPDREQGVMSIYASRPLTTRDYLLARAGALAIVSLGFLVLPQLIFYFGFATTSPAGFVSYLTDNFGDFARSVATAGGYLAMFGAAAFGVAMFTKRVAPAASAFIAGMYGSVVVAEAITESGADGGRWFSLLAMPLHPQYVRDWIFDRSGDTPMERAGFEPWMSLVIIVAVVAATAYLIMRRYRRLG